MENEVGSEGDNMSESSLKTNESTPINLFSEFLVAVMTKDYEKALLLCEEILEYEPNNETARAFHVLIEERIALKEEEDASESGSSYSGSATSASSEYYSDDTSLSFTSSYDNLDEEDAASQDDDADSQEEEDSAEGVVISSTPIHTHDCPAFSSSGSDSSIVATPSKETVAKLRAKVVGVEKTDSDTG